MFLLATVPGLIKEAGFVKNVAQAFHGAGMASHAKGTLQHATNVARRYTPMERNAQGVARAATPLSSVRGNASPSFFDQQRIKHTDKALLGRKKMVQHRTQASQAYDQAFGTPSTWGGKQGKKLFQGVAGMTYDLPRALSLHPASTVGLKGALGVAGGAAILGFKDPYEYMLPSVVGNLAYTTTGAKRDTMAYAQGGAQEGLGNFVQGYSGAKFADRWRMAMDPRKTGVTANQYSIAPNGVDRGLGLIRNIGGLDEGYIRQQVARGIDQQAEPYMNKKAFMKSVSKTLGGLKNSYRTAPTAVRATLPLAGRASLVGGLGYMSYAGERDKVRTAAYDQGYDSAQYQAQKYYQNLPTWQRALTAVSPDMALKYGMSQMQAGKQGPGYNDMGQDKAPGQPVTTMYTRPDGTNVF